MTIWDLLHLCRRLWAAVLVGMTLTIGCAVVVIHQSGTYSGEVDVILLAPPSQTRNVFAETTSSLVMLAGVVARISGGPGGAARSVSDNVTLVGEGQDDGFSIAQPNAGGQWEYRFERPVLHIESAGSTQEMAAAQMNLAVTTVRRTLQTLESRSAVSPASMVRIQMAPAEPAYTFVHGSRSRALGATGLIGILLTIGAVLAADRSSVLRRRRSVDRPST